MDVIIVGGGIGGLTLALTLHRAGIAARVYETAGEFRPLGVGINILPHATRELAALGLEDALARVAVATREAVFYNRFGQLIHREPLGRDAGYAWPQFSIHRGDLHAVLLAACRERIGADRIHAGWRCTHVEQDGDGAIACFVDAATGAALPAQRGDAVIGCDGLHSAVRKALHPGEGAPLYSGVNMWRGVTRWPPFLSHASMVRAGWLDTGKMVIYPIRDHVDAQGHQLVNWVAEIRTPRYRKRDWNRPGELSDFIDAFADWHFDWLDVPAFLRAADAVLEFPMIDQDPLPWWSEGRVTLLGDAAHPMVPRGSNGAGQAILDARALADSLSAHADPIAALSAYEATRLPATSAVVLANRANPPDAILREVYLRTGDRPFERIEDVITHEEIMAMSDGYKRVAGYHRDGLAP
jgi:2-polyprenyl-6-methoxyphenol hydroxylase-like FAD-dependent oxidoreductase